LKKYLIISVNAIGDTFISLTAIEKLKKRFDDVRIDFAIDNLSKFLFDPFVEIKTYILKNKNPTSLLKLILEVRKQNYDYVLNFFSGRYNSALTFLAKGKIKAGYFNLSRLSRWDDKSQKVKVIGLNNIGKLWIPQMSYLKRVELVLNSVGINEEINSKYKYPNISINKSNFIIIHPFSRYLDKALSFETITLLVEEIKIKYGAKIAIIGNQKEFETEYFRLKNYSLVELIYKNKIEDLISFIIYSSLFIAVDSFPLHVADAYNSNFVGVFGPTNPNSVLINKNKSIKIETNSLFSYNHNKIVFSVMKKIEEIMS
jgi:ADP-heptose:LPS heptosyltransferase